MHRRQHLVERDVVGFDQEIERQAARGEQLERGGEAGGVVVVRAERGELQDDHAVVVRPGEVVPGADEHEHPGRVELIERPFGRGGPAGALEDHVVRLRNGHTHGRAGQVVGLDRASGAHGQRALPAERGRLAHRHVVHVMGCEHRDHEQPDRAGAGDEDAQLRLERVGDVDRVQGDRDGLGERSRARRQAVGHCQQPGRVHLRVARERPVEREVVGGRKLLADGGPPLQAGSALAAGRGRPGDHPGADRDVGHALADGRHDAGPFVAEHGAGAPVALEHEVQVGAADPAPAHFHERLPRTELGDRLELHAHRVGPVEHGGGHRGTGARRGVGGRMGAGAHDGIMQPRARHWQSWRGSQVFDPQRPIPYIAMAQQARNPGPRTARSAQTATGPTPTDGRKTLDELVAERNAGSIPPPPVFTLEITDPTAPSTERGKKRLAELEEHARHNARVAEEARAAALEQRRHLEASAQRRLEVERDLAALQREINRIEEEQERLIAQARFRAEHEIRAELEAAGPAARIGTAGAPAPSPNAAELERLQAQLAAQEELSSDHRDRLRAAVHERDAAILEGRRAVSAREHLERRMEEFTEALRRATDENRAAEADADTRLGEARAEIEQLRAALEDHARDAERIASLEEELGHERGRAEGAERRAGVLTADLDGAWAEHGTVTDALHAARCELDEAQLEIAEQRTRVAELKAEGEAAAERYQQAVAHTADVETHVAELESRIAALDQGARDGMTQTELVERTLAATREELVAAQAQLVAAGEQSEQLGQARDELASRSEELERALDGTREELVSAQAQLVASGEQSEHLAASLAAAEEERDFARARVAELDGAVARVNEEGEAASSRTVDLEAKLFEVRERAAASEKELRRLRRAAAKAERNAESDADAKAAAVEQHANASAALERAVIEARTERDRLAGESEQLTQELEAARADAEQLRLLVAQRERELVQEQEAHARWMRDTSVPSVSAPEPALVDVFAAELTELGVDHPVVAEPAPRRAPAAAEPVAASVAEPEPEPAAAAPERDDARPSGGIEARRAMLSQLSELASDAP